MSATRPLTRSAAGPYRRRQTTTTDDRRQRAKEYWPIRQASNNVNSVIWASNWLSVSNKNYYSQPVDCCYDFPGIFERRVHLAAAATPTVMNQSTPVQHETPRFHLDNNDNNDNNNKVDNHHISYRRVLIFSLFFLLRLHISKSVK